MADKKISALTSLAQGDVAVSTDVLPIVDTSATETKKVTAAALVGAGLTAGVTNVDINSGSIDGTTIGANSAAAGTFTNLTASGTVSFSGATVSNGGSVTTVDINGGTIDGASIGASSASTGSFTTLTTSSTVTLNGGTANGVLYLNGSKVATSGSALAFDGSKLEISSSAEQLKLTSSGDFSSTGTGYIRWYDSVGAKGYVGYAGTASRFDVQTGTGMNFFLNAVGGNAIFAVSNSEQMRLTSTGLGIGTSSPGFKLEVENSAGGTLAFFDQGSVGVKIGTYVTNTVWGVSDSSVSNGLFGSSNYLYLATNGVERLRLDSSGNLGLGVTPSAWQSGAKALEIGGNGYLAFTGGTAGGYIYNNAYLASGGNTYKATGYASALGIGPSGEFRFFTAPSGTAGNAISFTQAMTLDASGNLGLGTTAPLFALDISQAAPRIRQTAATGTNSSLIQLVNTGGTAYIGLDSSSGGLTTAYSLNLLHSGAYPICFSTSSTERARITAGGYSKFSNDGTYVSSTGSYHEMRNTASDWVVRASNTNATPYGVLVPYTTDKNDTGSEFLYCQGAANLRASIRSNGGLANYQSNNVDLSDARTKKDINPIASMWDKIGALEIVTYKYNDQTHDDVNVGVIAQQVEAVEPVWVDTDGFGKTPEGEEPLKTVYTKDITFAAIKALQEAMARIEQLEAKVAALEAK